MQRKETWYTRNFNNFSFFPFQIGNLIVNEHLAVLFKMKPEYLRALHKPLVITGIYFYAISSVEIGQIEFDLTRGKKSCKIRLEKVAKTTS